MTIPIETYSFLLLFTNKYLKRKISLSPSLGFTLYQIIMQGQSQIMKLLNKTEISLRANS